MSEKFEKFQFKNAIIDIGKVDFKDILKTRKPIIFDTNFLFITFEFKIDIIGEIKRIIGGEFNLFIYEGTLSELENIEKKKDKNKKFLPLIVTMLKRYNFKIIKSDKTYIDDQILNNVNDLVIVATNDKELRARCWKKCQKIMYMRQKSYLEIK